jgi:predicted NBD/HSP70 family sugar kinase
MYTKNMITAVDMGATKTLIAQFNTAGEIVHHVRFETPQNAREFVKQFETHMQGLARPTALVMGLPGQISDDGGTVLYCGNLPWRDVPLKNMLAETINCPVHLENDAAMAAVGEMHALERVPRLGFYLAIGTGLGSAVIVRGKLLSSMRRSEAGHMMLKDGNTWTEWEDLASGHAITTKFDKMAKDLTEPEQWQWLAENLAQGLSPIIATLLPQVIVFGGSVGRYFENYHSYLSEKLHRKLPDYIPIPEMSSATRLDDAVLYGCYYHATHQLARS